MHDAARITRSVKACCRMRTGRNAIVAYRLDPDVSGAYQRAWRTLVEPGSSILQVSITEWQFRRVRPAAESSENFCGCGCGHTRHARGRCPSIPICQLHVSCTLRVFRRTHCSVDRCLADTCGEFRRPPRGSTVIDTHNLAELHGRARYTWRLRFGGPSSLRVRSDGSGWDAFLAFVGRDGAPGPYSVVDGRSRRRVVRCRSVAWRAISRAGHHRHLQNPSGASISEAAQHCWRCLNSGRLVGPEPRLHRRRPPTTTDYDHLSEWPLAAWRNDQWSRNAFRGR